VVAVPLKPRQRYLLLEAAAARLEVDIRIERLSPLEDLDRPQGGLIRLGGRRVIILDKDRSLEDRTKDLARALARALRERGEGSLFLPPAVRQMLEEIPHGEADQGQG